MSDDIADDPHVTIARIFDEASAIGQADEGEDVEARRLGRPSGSAIPPAAWSGPNYKAPGFAGGYLLLTTLGTTGFIIKGL